MRFDRCGRILHLAETNVTAVMACLNNIGPGMDVVGPIGNYAFL